MDTNLLSSGLLWFLAFLFSTTCHEAAHAWAAKRGGDLTAYAGGQVTLDPIPHIRREPVGMVVMPWLSFYFAGWMMGWASAPYDPRWARRYPRRSAWMALAGPAANLALVLLTAAVIHAGIYGGFLDLTGRLSFDGMVQAVNSGPVEGAAKFLSIMFSLNLLLGAFNLLPFPPLDGFGVLGLLLPEQATLKLMDFRDTLGSMMFIGILIAWRAFDYIFTPVFLAGAELLYLPYQ
jgi:Zn-dependent protease